MTAMRVHALCSVPSQSTDYDRLLVVLYCNDCTFESCICLQLSLLSLCASLAIHIQQPATFGVSVQYPWHLLLLTVFWISCACNLREEDSCTPWSGHRIARTLSSFLYAQSRLTYCSISLADTTSHHSDRSFSNKILRQLLSFALLFSLCDGTRRDVLLEQALARYPRSRGVRTNVTSENHHDPKEELPAND